MLQRSDFGLIITRDFLRGRQPCPDIWPVWLLSRGNLEIGDSFCAIAVLAVVDTKEKICARQCWLDLQGAAEFCHCFRGTILKLIEQTKIHMDFGEIGHFSQYGPIFALSDSIVTPLLCLFRGREVSANGLADGSVRCRALCSRLAPTCSQQRHKPK